MGERIELTYNQAYTRFNWQMTPIEPRAQTLSQTTPSSSVSAAASSGVIATLAPVSAVSDFGVTPGKYLLEVQVIQDTKTSAWASANITLTSNHLAAVSVYPNPWRNGRHSTPITFGNLPSHTTVKIFTVSGHLLAELTGSGSISWDLKNKSGQAVASGIYLYTLEAAGQNTRGKFAIVR